MGAGVQLLTVDTWGQGGPAAYSGYMGTGVSSCLQWAHGGKGSSCLQWVHGGKGASCLQWVHGDRRPVASSRYMRARGRGYMGEGVQLLTGGT